jgi:hypothetical protein
MNLTELPESIRGPVRELGELLDRLAGDNLRAIAVYGQAIAPGNPDPAGFVKSIVTMSGMDLLLLDQLRHSGRRFGRHRLQAPLIMTPRYIEESLDSFPLELLEIQQLHIMILGTDDFAMLQFEPGNVRLQAERELKRCLIHLRQGLLDSAGKDQPLGPLCQHALEHLFRVFRGMLWLKEVPCPVQPGPIVDTVERLTQIDLAGLRGAFGSQSRTDFVWFQRFYRDVERLSDFINNLRVP